MSFGFGFLLELGNKAGQPWALDNEETFADLLKAAYDRGLNTWDTANVYSNGLNETWIGNATRRFAIPRHKIVLMTKCYGIVGEQPDVHELEYPSEIKASKDYVNQGGLSRSAIFHAVESSLARLQTQYVDVLQIHRYDYDVPIEETMKALHDLVQSGKVRYLGASSMWCYQFSHMQHVAELKGLTKFVSMQNNYSLLYREEEREMNRFCHETGTGIFPYAPLFRGLLARPYGDSPKSARERQLRSSSTFKEPLEHEKTIIKRVQELAGLKGWKMVHVALVWLVQKGAVPIVGVACLGHLQDVLELHEKSLTQEEVAWLEEPYMPKNISGHQ
ncbi:MAG: hypothetical protein Q9160_001295 [Pyrenula sp. 1 TL-2023]